MSVPETRLRTEKTQAITELLRKIACLRANPVKNRDKIVDGVNTVNALLIPRGWVGVEEDGTIHVTYIAKQRSTDEPAAAATKVNPTGFELGELMGISISHGVAHVVDCAWIYQQWTNTLTCAKCRGSRWKNGDVIDLDQLPVKLGVVV